jgi:hypothetical protein
MDAFECPRQSQSLPIEFTHAALDPKNDGRERAMGTWVIVFAGAVFQGRPPKGGDINSNRQIPLKTMFLPTRLRFDMLSP